MRVDWSVRESARDDLASIYELAKRTYGSDPKSISATFTYDHLCWQLLQNPDGPFRASVAHIGEKLVGFYGVIPAVLYYQGKKVAGSLSLLTMTHPDYQRQGILTTLASSLYKQLGEEGVAITYGFPNENSLPGLIHRLQWTHIATLDVYVRPLNVATVVGVVAKIPFIAPIAGAMLSPLFSRVSSNQQSGFMLRQVTQFDGRADSLMEARKGMYVVQRVRDCAYLNWRYVKCPDWQYRIVIAEDKADLLGYVVLRCMTQFGMSGGMIVDMAALPGRSDVLLALIREAVVLSLEGGMDLVACLIHGDTDIVQALRQSWFVKVPSRFGFKKWYFGARLNNGQLPAEQVNSSTSWFLTFGDDDIL